MRFVIENCMPQVNSSKRKWTQKKKNHILSNNFVHSKVILNTKTNKERKNEIGYQLSGPIRVEKVMEPMMS